MILKVFISSPSDADDERKLVHKAIDALNPKLWRLFNCQLQAIDWKEFATLTTHTGQMPQDLLLPWVRHSTVFIGILKSRYGSPAHPPSTISGTEEEFNLALNSDRVAILSYFLDLSKIDIRSGQIEDLVKLRNRLDAKNIVPKNYKKKSEFLSFVMADLMELVISNLPDSEHRMDLMEFFQLGRSLSQVAPEVLIIYPPIHSQDPSRDQHLTNWHNRLVPNVVFEDAKAIHKLESSIQKLGIRSVKSVTTISPTAQDHDRNKIWLCLPRNDMAQRRLETYKDKVRFRLEEEANEQKVIKWKSKIPSDNEITVRSPQAKYLLRRGESAIDAPWKEEYGNIVVRDYAIVSRFLYEGPWRDRAQHNFPFWEYFIFGIRGLGTWGAAWFIHNQSNKLAEIVKNQNTDDIQILLQVTFFRQRIHEVIDVSSQNQDYFDMQMEPDYIEKIAKEFHC